MGVHITGDTHRYFDKVYYTCVEYATTPDDIMIILGDAGINYYLGESDAALKEELSGYPITLFMIHGNHEERPSEIDTYEIKRWHKKLICQPKKGKGITRYGNDRNTILEQR